MLGTRPESGLFSAAAQLDLKRLGIYGHLATEGRRLFNDLVDLPTEMWEQLRKTAKR